MHTNADTPKTTESHSRFMLLFLLFTALVCGAMIMVVEVLGSRVIGPFFGVSLFVWTSLITVTLVALALGYAIGGRFADRRGTADYLYGIILLAGLAVLLIPVYKMAVLKLCVPLGLRLGAFVSASLLFGPSLFLLGCVSPLLVKIAVREMKNIGRTVGGFYAISTIGSVIGTVVTGFVLIAYLGVNSIFHLVGLSLCLLALGYFILIRRAWWMTLGLIVVFLFPSGQPGVLPSVQSAYGQQVSLIAHHDSYYGSLKVIDYQDQRVHNRDMLIDGLMQGSIDVVSGESIEAFSYFMTLLPYALNPDMDNALVIGLGAGLVPNWLEKRGIQTDAVDIDPAVFDFAERYFNVRLSGRKVKQDARYFLQNSLDVYDLVVLDAFTGDSTPGHLVSLEALQLVEKRLSDQGILAVNLIIDSSANNYMAASVVKTLEQVFDQVQAFRTVGPQQSPGIENLALIAYRGEERIPDESYLNPNSIAHQVRRQVMDNIYRRFEFPDDTAAIILTDDYNPLDVFDIATREELRRRILEHSEWDILGYSG
ncbi:MAG: fused MFS/spermidine synthase [Xanthomonadales bacterium]|nr:fused MFS/spermidine synthase [Xanthomonadales bacterium]